MRVNQKHRIVATINLISLVFNLLTPFFYLAKPVYAGKTVTKKMIQDAGGSYTADDGKTYTLDKRGNKRIKDSLGGRSKAEMEVYCQNHPEECAGDGATTEWWKDCPKEKWCGSGASGFCARDDMLAKGMGCNAQIKALTGQDPCYVTGSCNCSGSCADNQYVTAEGCCITKILYTENPDQGCKNPDGSACLEIDGQEYIGYRENEGVIEALKPGSEKNWIPVMDQDSSGNYQFTVAAEAALASTENDQGQRLARDFLKRLGQALIDGANEQAATQRAAMAKAEEITDRLDLCFGVECQILGPISTEAMYYLVMDRFLGAQSECVAEVNPEGCLNNLEAVLQAEVRKLEREMGRNINIDLVNEAKQATKGMFGQQYETVHGVKYQKMSWEFDGGGVVAAVQKQPAEAEVSALMQIAYYNDYANVLNQGAGIDLSDPLVARLYDQMKQECLSAAGVGANRCRDNDEIARRALGKLRGEYGGMGAQVAKTVMENRAISEASVVLLISDAANKYEYCRKSFGETACGGIKNASSANYDDNLAEFEAKVLSQVFSEEILESEAMQVQKQAMEQQLEASHVQVTLAAEADEVSGVAKETVSHSQAEVEALNRIKKDLEAFGAFEGFEQQWKDGQVSAMAMEEELEAQGSESKLMKFLINVNNWTNGFYFRSTNSKLYVDGRAELIYLSKPEIERLESLAISGMSEAQVKAQLRAFVEQEPALLRSGQITKDLVDELIGGIIRGEIDAVKGIEISQKSEDQLTGYPGVGSDDLKLDRQKQAWFQAQIKINDFAYKNPDKFDYLISAYGDKDKLIDQLVSAYKIKAEASLKGKELEAMVQQEIWLETAVLNGRLDVVELNQKMEKASSGADQGNVLAQAYLDSLEAGVKQALEAQVMARYGDRLAKENKSVEEFQLEQLEALRGNQDLKLLLDTAGVRVGLIQAVSGEIDYQSLDKQLGSSDYLENALVKSALAMNRFTNGSFLKGRLIAVEGKQQWTECQGGGCYAEAAGKMAQGWVMQGSKLYGAALALVIPGAQALSLAAAGGLTGAAALSLSGTAFGSYMTGGSAAQTAEVCGYETGDANACVGSALMTIYSALSTGLGAVSTNNMLIQAQAEKAIADASARMMAATSAEAVVADTNVIVQNSAKMYTSQLAAARLMGVNKASAWMGTAAFGYQAVNVCGQDGLTADCFLTAATAAISLARALTPVQNIYVTTEKGQQLSTAGRAIEYSDRTINSLQAAVVCSSGGWGTEACQSALVGAGLSFGVAKGGGGIDAELEASLKIAGLPADQQLLVLAQEIAKINDPELLGETVSLRGKPVVLDETVRQVYLADLERAYQGVVFKLGQNEVQLELALKSLEGSEADWTLAQKTLAGLNDQWQLVHGDDGQFLGEYLNAEGEVVLMNSQEYQQLKSILTAAGAGVYNELQLLANPRSGWQRLAAAVTGEPEAVRDYKAAVDEYLDQVRGLKVGEQGALAGQESAMARLSAAYGGVVALNAKQVPVESVARVRLEAAEPPPPDESAVKLAEYYAAPDEAGLVTYESEAGSGKLKLVKTGVEVVLEPEVAARMEQVNRILEQVQKPIDEGGLGYPIAGENAPNGRANQAEVLFEIVMGKMDAVEAAEAVRVLREFAGGGGKSSTIIPTAALLKAAVNGQKINVLATSFTDINNIGKQFPLKIYADNGVEAVYYHPARKEVYFFNGSEVEVVTGSRAVDVLAKAEVVYSPTAETPYEFHANRSNDPLTQAFLKATAGSVPLFDEGDMLFAATRYSSGGQESYVVSEAYPELTKRYEDFYQTKAARDLVNAGISEAVTGRSGLMISDGNNQVRLNIEVEQGQKLYVDLLTQAVKSAYEAVGLEAPVLAADMKIVEEINGLKQNIDSGELAESLSQHLSFANKMIHYSGVSPNSYGFSEQWLVFAASDGRLQNTRPQNPVDALVFESVAQRIKLETQGVGESFAKTVEFVGKASVSSRGETNTWSQILNSGHYGQEMYSFSATTEAVAEVAAVVHGIEVQKGSSRSTYEEIWVPKEDGQTVRPMVWEAARDLKDVYIPMSEEGQITRVEIADKGVSKELQIQRVVETTQEFRGDNDVYVYVFNNDQNAAVSDQLRVYVNGELVEVEVPEGMAIKDYVEAEAVKHRGSRTERAAVVYDYGSGRGTDISGVFAPHQVDSQGRIVSYSKDPQYIIAGAQQKQGELTVRQGTSLADVNQWIVRAREIPGEATTFILGMDRTGVIERAEALRVFEAVEGTSGNGLKQQLLTNAIAQTYSDKAFLMIDALEKVMIDADRLSWVPGREIEAPRVRIIENGVELEMSVFEYMKRQFELSSGLNDSIDLKTTTGEAFLETIASRTQGFFDGFVTSDEFRLLPAAAQKFYLENFVAGEGRTKVSLADTALGGEGYLMQADNIEELTQMVNRLVSKQDVAQVVFDSSADDLAFANVVARESQAESRLLAPEAVEPMVEAGRPIGKVIARIGEAIKSVANSVKSGWLSRFGRSAEIETDRQQEFVNRALEWTRPGRVIEDSVTGRKLQIAEGEEYRVIRAAEEAGGVVYRNLTVEEAGDLRLGDVVYRVGDGQVVETFEGMSLEKIEEYVKQDSQNEFVKITDDEPAWLPRVKQTVVGGLIRAVSPEEFRLAVETGEYGRIRGYWAESLGDLVDLRIPKTSLNGRYSAVVAGLSRWRQAAESEENFEDQTEAIRQELIELGLEEEYVVAVIEGLGNVYLNRLSAETVELLSPELQPEAGGGALGVWGGITRIRQWVEERINQPLREWLRGWRRDTASEEEESIERVGELEEPRGMIGRFIDFIIPNSWKDSLALGDWSFLPLWLRVLVQPVSGPRLADDDEVTWYGSWVLKGMGVGLTSDKIREIGNKIKGDPVIVSAGKYVLSMVNEGRGAVKLSEGTMEGVMIAIGAEAVKSGQSFEGLVGAVEKMKAGVGVNRELLEVIANDRMMLAHLFSQFTGQNIHVKEEILRRLPELPFKAVEVREEAMVISFQLVDLYGENSFGLSRFIEVGVNGSDLVEVYLPLTAEDYQRYKNLNDPRSIASVFEELIKEAEVRLDVYVSLGDYEVVPLQQELVNMQMVFKGGVNEEKIRQLVLELLGENEGVGGGVLEEEIGRPEPEKVRKSLEAYQLVMNGELLVDIDHFEVAQKQLASQQLSKETLDRLFTKLGLEMPVDVNQAYLTIYDRLAEIGYSAEIVNIINEGGYVDPRREVTIEYQSRDAKVQSVLEAVSNSVDALLHPSRSIGQFSKGVKQAEGWLESPGDSIEVYTKKGDQSYRLRLVKDQVMQTYISIARVNDEVLPEGLKTEESGTWLSIVVARPITAELKEVLIERVNERFPFVRSINLATKVDGQDWVSVNGFKNKRTIVPAGTAEFDPEESGENRVRLSIENNKIEVVDNGSGVVARTVDSKTGEIKSGPVAPVLSRMFVKGLGTKQPVKLTAAEIKKEIGNVRVVVDKTLPAGLSLSRMDEVILTTRFNENVLGNIADEAVFSGGVQLELGLLLEVGESRAEVILTKEAQMAVNSAILQLAQNSELSVLDRLIYINTIIAGLDGVIKGNPINRTIIADIRQKTKEVIQPLVDQVTDEDYVILPHEKGFTKLEVSGGKQVVYLHPLIFDWKQAENLQQIGGVELQDITAIRGEKQRRVPIVIMPFKDETLKYLAKFQPKSVNLPEEERLPIIKTPAMVVIPPEIGNLLNQLAKTRSQRVSLIREIEADVDHPDRNILDDLRELEEHYLTLYQLLDIESADRTVTDYELAEEEITENLSLPPVRVLESEEKIDQKERKVDEEIVAAFLALKATAERALETSATSVKSGRRLVTTTLDDVHESSVNSLRLVNQKIAIKQIEGERNFLVDLETGEEYLQFAGVNRIEPLVNDHYILHYDNETQAAIGIDRILVNKGSLKGGGMISRLPYPSHAADMFAFDRGRWVVYFDNSGGASWVYDVKNEAMIGLDQLRSFLPAELQGVSGFSHFEFFEPKKLMTFYVEDDLGKAHFIIVDTVSWVVKSAIPLEVSKDQIKRVEIIPKTAGKRIYKYYDELNNRTGIIDIESGKIIYAQGTNYLIDAEGRYIAVGDEKNNLRVYSPDLGDFITKSHYKWGKIIGFRIVHRDASAPIYYLQTNKGFYEISYMGEISDLLPFDMGSFAYFYEEIRRDTTIIDGFTVRSWSSYTKRYYEDYVRLSPLDDLLIAREDRDVIVDTFSGTFYATGYVNDPAIDFNHGSGELKMRRGREEWIYDFSNKFKGERRNDREVLLLTDDKNIWLVRDKENGIQLFDNHQSYQSQKLVTLEFLPKDFPSHLISWDGRYFIFNFENGEAVYVDHSFPNTPVKVSVGKNQLAAQLEKPSTEASGQLFGLPDGTGQRYVLTDDKNIREIGTGRTVEWVDYGGMGPQELRKIEYTSNNVYLVTFTIIGTSREFVVPVKIVDGRVVLIKAQNRDKVPAFISNSVNFVISQDKRWMSIVGKDKVERISVGPLIDLEAEEAWDYMLDKRKDHFYKPRFSADSRFFTAIKQEIDFTGGHRFYLVVVDLKTNKTAEYDLQDLRADFEQDLECEISPYANVVHLQNTRSSLATAFVLEEEYFIGSNLGSYVRTDSSGQYTVVFNPEGGMVYLHGSETAISRETLKLNWKIKGEVFAIETINQPNGVARMRLTVKRDWKILGFTVYTDRQEYFLTGDGKFTTIQPEEIKADLIGSLREVYAVSGSISLSKILDVRGKTIDVIDKSRVGYYPRVKKPYKYELQMQNGVYKDANFGMFYQRLADGNLKLVDPDYGSVIKAREGRLLSLSERMGDYRRAFYQEDDQPGVILQLVFGKNASGIKFKSKGGYLNTGDGYDMKEGYVVFYDSNSNRWSLMGDLGETRPGTELEIPKDYQVRVEGKYFVFTNPNTGEVIYLDPTDSQNLKRYSLGSIPVVDVSDTEELDLASLTRGGIDINTGAREEVELVEEIGERLEEFVEQARLAYEPVFSLIPVDHRANIEHELLKQIDRLYNDQVEALIVRQEEAIGEVDLSNLPIERFAEKMVILLPLLESHLKSEMVGRMEQEGVEVAAEYYKNLFVNLMSVALSQEVEDLSIEFQSDLMVGSRTRNLNPADLRLLGLGWDLVSDEKVDNLWIIRRLVDSFEELDVIVSNKTLQRILSFLSEASNQNSERGVVVANQLVKFLQLIDNQEVVPEVVSGNLAGLVTTFEDADEKLLMDYLADAKNHLKLGVVRSYAIILTNDVKPLPQRQEPELGGRILWRADSAGSAIAPSQLILLNNEWLKLRQSGETSEFMPVDYLLGRIGDLPEVNKEIESEIERNISVQGEPMAGHREINQNAYDEIKRTGQKDGRLTIEVWLEKNENGTFLVESASDNGSGVAQGKEMALAIPGSTKEEGQQADSIGFFGTGKYEAFRDYQLVDQITNGENGGLVLRWMILDYNTNVPKLRLYEVRGLEAGQGQTRVTWLRKKPTGDMVLPELEDMLSQEGWKIFAGLTQDETYSIAFKVGDDEVPLEIEHQVLAEDDFVAPDFNSLVIDELSWWQRLLNRFRKEKIQPEIGYEDKNFGKGRIIATEGMPTQVLEKAGHRVNAIPERFLVLIPDQLRRFIDELGINIQIPLAVIRERNAFANEGEAQERSYTEYIQRFVATKFYQALARKLIEDPSFTIPGDPKDILTNYQYQSIYSDKAGKRVVEIAAKINKGQILEKDDLQFLVESSRLGGQSEILSKLVVLLRVQVEMEGEALNDISVAGQRKAVLSESKNLLNMIAAVRIPEVSSGNNVSNDRETVLRSLGARREAAVDFARGLGRSFLIAAGVGSVGIVGVYGLVNLAMYLLSGVVPLSVSAAIGMAVGGGLYLKVTTHIFDRKMPIQTQFIEKAKQISRPLGVKGIVLQREFFGHAGQWYGGVPLLNRVFYLNNSLVSGELTKQVNVIVHEAAHGVETRSLGGIRGLVSRSRKTTHHQIGRFSDSMKYAAGLALYDYEIPERLIEINNRLGLGEVGHVNETGGGARAEEEARYLKGEELKNRISQVQWEGDLVINEEGAGAGEKGGVVGRLGGLLGLGSLMCRLMPAAENWLMSLKDSGSWGVFEKPLQYLAKKHSEVCLSWPVPEVIEPPIDGYGENVSLPYSEAQHYYCQDEGGGKSTVYRMMPDKSLVNIGDCGENRTCQNNYCILKPFEDRGMDFSLIDPNYRRLKDEHGLNLVGMNGTSFSGTMINEIKEACDSLPDYWCDNVAFVLGGELEEDVVMGANNVSGMVFLRSGTTDFSSFRNGLVHELMHINQSLFGYDIDFSAPEYSAFRIESLEKSRVGAETVMAELLWLTEWDFNLEQEQWLPTVEGKPLELSLEDFSLRENYRYKSPNEMIAELGVDYYQDSQLLKQKNEEVYWFLKNTFFDGLDYQNYEVVDNEIDSS